MAKKAQTSKDIKFEEALCRLEEIVSQMESEELPIEDLLKKYQEGTKLRQLCEKKLEEAEKQIEVVLKDKKGKIKKVPLESVDKEESGE